MSTKEFVAVGAIQRLLQPARAGLEEQAEVGLGVGSLLKNRGVSHFSRGQSLDPCATFDRPNNFTDGRAGRFGQHIRKPAIDPPLTRQPPSKALR